MDKIYDDITFEYIFNLRKLSVSILADIIKLETMSIKAIFKDSKKS